MATVPLNDGHVPSILAAFDLGPWGRLSNGPVASGRFGSIWRLDTERGSWAVKQVGEIADEDLAERLEGGVPGGGARRRCSDACAATYAGRASSSPDCGGVRVTLHAWVDLRTPETVGSSRNSRWISSSNGFSTASAGARR
jgi:hypothetical protein